MAERSDGRSVDWTEMLAKMATFYLQHTRGVGFWKLREDREVDPKPEDCLNLGVGDLVYWFDEEEHLIRSFTVCVVMDEVPFVVRKVGRATSICPVIRDCYYATIEDLKASEEHRKNSEWLLRLARNSAKSEAMKDE